MEVGGAAAHLGAAGETGPGGPAPPRVPPDVRRVMLVWVGRMCVFKADRRACKWAWVGVDMDTQSQLQGRGGGGGAAGGHSRVPERQGGEEQPGHAAVHGTVG